MLNFRLFAAGFAALTLAGLATADFDGPAPLAWRWIQPTSAEVKGSPLIDGDTVYVAIGQRAFGLDKTTGNQKWRFPLVDPIDGYFIGAPVMMDGVLVVTADNRKVYGLDPTTGQLKWTYTAAQPIIGAAVHAGKYAVISESDNSIMAINPEDGTPAWLDGTSHEAPVHMLFGVNGTLTGTRDSVLVMDNNNEMISLNLSTKKPNWTARFTVLDPTAQPTVVGDEIIVNSGQYLVSLRMSNGRKAWEMNMPTNVRVGAAVSGSGIFVVDEDGQAMFYDMNGRRMLKKPIDLGSYPMARPAVAGNLFVVPTTNGAINLVDPVKGTVSWSYLIRPIGVQYNPSSTTTSSGGPGGRNPGGSQAANQPPDRIWTIQAAGTPIVSGNTLLVLARDGSLLAFDKDSGVDLTPPAVSMSWPKPGDQVNGESLEVLFKIQDEASGVNTNSLKITVDGAPTVVDFGRDGIASIRFSSASKNLPLTNGRKVFTVTVSDWMGNTSSQQFVLNIDNMLPKSVRPASSKADGPGGKGGGPGGSSGG